MEATFWKLQLIHIVWKQEKIKVKFSNQQNNQIQFICEIIVWTAMFIVIVHTNNHEGIKRLFSSFYINQLWLMSSLNSYEINTVTFYNLTWIVSA